MRGTGERYQDSSGGTFSCEAIGKTLSKPLHRQTILEMGLCTLPRGLLHIVVQQMDVDGVPATASSYMSQMHRPILILQTQKGSILP